MRRRHQPEPLLDGPEDSDHAAGDAVDGRSAQRSLIPTVPTMEAARARLSAVRPSAYARTRNALDGAVTGLSPYITHGLLSLTEVLTAVNARHPLDVQHKWVYELGWRAFFRHVWQHRGESILRSLHEGPLPEDAYDNDLPADIRQARTGVPVIDQAVRTLYASGTLHNHARMWLASYVVHLRKVHWRAGADWMYGHLLDGDLASNHLSWQWVAGTGSRKPYLFNAENVARYAPADWHSPGTAVDASYEVLDRWARTPGTVGGPDTTMNAEDALPDAATGNVGDGRGREGDEPGLRGSPAETLGLKQPNAAAVTGRDVWLVHPWALGDLPPGLPAETVVVGIYLSEFHQAWPWNERRWQFVDQRMAALTPQRWWGPARAFRDALAQAARVRGQLDPHLASWVLPWAEWLAPPMLFPPVAQRCDSFSQWWRHAVRGMGTASELLAVNEVAAR
ncbi:deoxyribodipyrimidine photolyase [Roseateles sp. SL47]|uniref:FAD-binding domain-containing protein n=1 Tax=Roseateles sp. SL47 TaxID=2995138 RepID=UPI00227043EE|nr:FAD-binding domain-containing protein [Roseateles sp. SL47]WAC71538.1 deoxyribodipyrimidine photolyase [Roseateles sp. SL47]